MGAVEAEGWLIRPAVPADARPLTALHVTARSEAYGDLVPAEVLSSRRRDTSARAAEWRRSLDPADPERPATFVAQATEPGHPLIGFATIGAARGEDPPAEREVWGLYVRASWWGTPVGWHLLRYGLGDSPAFVWVPQRNERALGFCRRQGFRPDGATAAAELGVEQRLVRAGAPIVTDWS